MFFSGAYFSNDESVRFLPVVMVLAGTPITASKTNPTKKLVNMINHINLINMDV